MFMILCFFFFLNKIIVIAPDMHLDFLLCAGSFFPLTHFDWLTQTLFNINTPVTLRLSECLFTISMSLY